MNRHRVRCVAFVVVLFTVASCSAVEKLASAASGGSCSGPTPLTTGGSVSGQTSGVSCKAPDGSVGNVYTLNAAQATNVEINLTPNGFQPWLGVFTSSGSLIAQTNTSPWRFKLFLAPGSYQVGVSPVGSKDGSFTLTTAPAELTACKLGPGSNVSAEDNGITMKGAVITGRLTDSDCGGGATRTEGYGLSGATAGSTWTFTFTADRAAGVGVFIGNQQVASKSLTTAGSTTLTVAGTADPTFRVFVTGAPGTGVINYTLAIN
jgi:hypothetical protein